VIYFVILLLSIESAVVNAKQADFTPLDAALDTVEGRFRGPSQEAAMEVKEMIQSVLVDRQKRSVGEASAPPQRKKKRRRIKKQQQSHES
jgi:hypothetical protein